MQLFDIQHKMLQATVITFHCLSSDKNEWSRQMSSDGQVDMYTARGTIGKVRITDEGIKQHKVSLLYWGKWTGLREKELGEYKAPDKQRTTTGGGALTCYVKRSFSRLSKKGEGGRGTFRVWLAPGLAAPKRFCSCLCFSIIAKGNLSSLC